MYHITSTVWLLGFHEVIKSSAHNCRIVLIYHPLYSPLVCATFPQGVLSKTNTWWKDVWFYTPICLEWLEEASSDYFPHCVTIFLGVYDQARCCHSLCPCPCNLWVAICESDWRCVFLLFPVEVRKQVAWRLKYWWMMINSCGWWKSEAHPSRRCVFWS